ncbi:hypothetical protein ACN677_14590 [Lactiplantibacillus paraplantarum]|uniref:hypothetical protein n=2 Tax=Lactiplantibacillus paraplantarum TaxID=60520 RepID=UPI0005133C14|nr:hypothetical protein [Lactiplantibacillus paraplantarum]KGE76031.1 membrane protein [Lactiplantibacillus paraplantarum]RDG11266.1 hypothetical protein DQM08_09475 [Lactiplantibacillus paraplantarum]
MRWLINKGNLYRSLIVGLVMIQLLEMVVPLNLTVIDAIVAIGVAVLGIKNLSRSFQIATFVFFIAGLGLLSTTGLSLDGIATAIVSMVDIVVLLVVMQLFLIPVTVGKYQAAVEAFMQDHVHGPKQTYTFVMLVTHLLSSILSMGTVAIVLSILGDSIKRQVKDAARFSATAVTRAFTLGTLWAPGAATIFLISTVTKVSWTRLFIPCLILGLLGLVLAHVMERHQAYMQVKPSVIKRDTVRKNKGHASLLGLVLAVIALLLLSFVLMENKVASSMDSVTLAGLLIVVIWTGLLGVKRDNSLPAFKPVLKKSMRAYWHHGITSGASLAPFFVGIGTFTYGFQHSTVSTQIVATLTPLFAQLGWWLVLLIPIIVVLVSLIGIHPLASVALIGKVIMAMHISLSPLLIALSLNIGSVAAYMLSPFAGIVMIVATLLNVAPGTVSIRWNWQFCSLFLVLSIIVAILLNLVF